MIYAIYNRHSHPPGYGMCGGPTRETRHSSGTAHGYVTLIVECASETVRDAVTNRLRSYKNMWDWPGRKDLWYGGQFDLVAELHDPETIRINANGVIRPADMPLSGDLWVSLGDNRAVAVTRADTVLDEPETPVDVPLTWKRAGW